MDINQRTTCCKSFTSFWADHWRGVVKLTISIIFFLTFRSLNKIDGSPQEVMTFRCLYIYCLMAALWITRVIPTYVTSFLPILAFSVWRINHAEVIVTKYFDNCIAMFIGAVTMELAIEHCDLHKRIALRIIMLAGNKPCRILWTLIFISCFMSFWISNTATTIVMCAIVDEIVDDLDELEIIKAFEQSKSMSEPRATRAASGFYLSVTYAATIGGAGTILGTGTNMALKSLHDLRYSRLEYSLNFLTFSMYTLPMVLLFTIFLCLWMHLIFLRKKNTGNENNEILNGEMYNLRSSYKSLSRMSFHEIQIAVLFIIMIVLLGVQSYMFSRTKEITIEASPVLIGVTFLLFLLPKNYKFLNCCGSAPAEKKETGSLLSCNYALKNIPWGYIFIVGAGRALLDAIRVSGTNEFIAYNLTPLRDFPLWSVLLCVLIIAAIFGLFIPSIIFCNLFYPILYELAKVCKTGPLHFIFPATIASGYCFLTPTAAPGLEHVTIYQYVPLKYILLGGIGPTIMSILLLFLNAEIYFYLTK